MEVFVLILHFGLSLWTLTLQILCGENALSLWPSKFTIFLSTHYSSLRTLFAGIVRRAGMWQAVDTKLFY